MPWLTRSTAVTIIVLLSGYTLLLTLTLNVPHPTQRLKAVGVKSTGSGILEKKSVVDDREVSPACVDRNDRCGSWKQDGQCFSNPSYMLENCRKTCGGCARKPLHIVPQKVKLESFSVLQGPIYAGGITQECWDGQVDLNNEVSMPRVGFGTAGLGENTKQSTLWALQAGYRMLDSAQVPS